MVSKTQSEEPNFRAMLEKIQTACLILSPQLEIVAVTDAFVEATMTVREKILGRYVFDVFPENPSDKTATGETNLRGSLERVLSTKNTDSMAVQKYDIRKPGVEEFEVRYWSPVNSPVCDENGNIKYILHTVVDVTEYVKIKNLGQEQGEINESLKSKTSQMEAQIMQRAQELQEVNKQLRLADDRFRLLVDSVQDYAIIILSKDGTITSWNSGAAKIFLYSADEIIGKHISILSGEEDIKSPTSQKELDEAANTGRFEWDGWRVRNNGTQFWSNLTVWPIYSKDQAISGFAKVVRDLTERKANEDQLQKMTEDLTRQTASLMAVNQELEAFSYSISHDLRAPLRSMGGFSQILIDEYGSKLDPQALDFLGRISTSAKFMGDLIDGLLKLSRVSRQPLNKVPIRVSTLVQNLVSEIESTYQEPKTEVIIEKNILVDADPLLLRAALFNLMNNAFKFTRKNPSPKIEFGRTTQDDRQLFFVRDNGAGFDMKYKDKLFGAFQRLHSANEFEGTGIGLATVQRIVRRHGGEIWAESEMGRGTTFYFTL
jgi:PAS domain S-box-containing protein